MTEYSSSDYVYLSPSIPIINSYFPVTAFYEIIYSFSEASLLSISLVLRGDFAVSNDMSTCIAHLRKMSCFETESGFWEQRATQVICNNEHIFTPTTTPPPTPPPPQPSEKTPCICWCIGNALEPMKLFCVVDSHVCMVHMCACIGLCLFVNFWFYARLCNISIPSSNGYTDL